MRHRDAAAGHRPCRGPPAHFQRKRLGLGGLQRGNLQLRRSSFLLAKGHRFSTQSDTEVLVHLYQQEGVEGIGRLRGMFAYCIWDARRQRILLVRDRFGKKPLYYAASSEGLHFASELKCLLAAGLLGEIDEEALRLYFLLSYIPDPYTAFRAARKLEPAG